MNLNEKLLAIQRAIPTLTRDGVNPHFRNQYLTLESLIQTVVPALNNEGIVLTQAPTVVDGQPALRTRFTDTESGEYVEDTMLLMSAQANPQQQGSAITYARRYALVSMLGLIAETDDDGNTATAPARAVVSVPVAAESVVAAGSTPW